MIDVDRLIENYERAGETSPQHRYAYVAVALRLLRDEVKAWRDCPRHYFSKVYDQPHMSGLERVPQRARIWDAMAAVDAALKL